MALRDYFCQPPHPNDKPKDQLGFGEFDPIEIASSSM